MDVVDSVSIHRDEPQLVGSLEYLLDFHRKNKVLKTLHGTRNLNGSFSDNQFKRTCLKKPHASCVSRLEFLPEGGGKTRVVALADIYTQSALLPLHDFIMVILRQIPQDCTFDQEKGVTVLKQRTLKGEKAFCFDLSNCTDRFPIFLQEAVVSHLTSLEYAAH